MPVGRTHHVLELHFYVLVQKDLFFALADTALQLRLEGRRAGVHAVGFSLEELKLLPLIV